MELDNRLNDSGTCLDNFFEGTEKSLEIWFSFNERDAEKADLRFIPRPALDSILDKVKAKILSYMRSDDVDSYVLSESSLFITKEKLVLKTCGTTTLLLGLNDIVNFAYEYTSAIRVEGLIYKRKNMLRPHMQEYPHVDFDSETNYLLSIFPEGKAHTFGKDERGWVIFMYKNNNNTLQISHSFDRSSEMQKNYDLMPGSSKMITSSSKTELSIGEIFSNTKESVCEILMSELDEQKMRNFYKESSPCSDNFSSISAETVSSFGSSDSMLERSSLSKCFEPGTQFGHYEFEPFGFSMNTLKEHIYHTIHVTPQPECSYASCQNNMPLNEGLNSCKTVSRVFDPKTLVLNIFSIKEIQNFTNEIAQNFDRYDIDDMETIKMGDYNIYYASLTRKCVAC